MCIWCQKDRRTARYSWHSSSARKISRLRSSAHGPFARTSQKSQVSLPFPFVSRNQQKTAEIKQCKNILFASSSIERFRRLQYYFLSIWNVKYILSILWYLFDSTPIHSVQPLFYVHNRTKVLILKRQRKERNIKLNTVFTWWKKFYIF